MSCSAWLRYPRDRHRLVFAYSAIGLRLLSSRPRPGRGLKECLRLLQLPEDGVNSHAVAKEAYLRMAKLYHPDSGAPTADAALFSQIKEAYRVVLAHLAYQKSILQNTQEEEEEGKVKGYAPQHRHYLSYGGVGFGAPSQREWQYRQFQMDRATDEVFEYRYKAMEKASTEEGTMVLRDRRLRSKKIQITQGVERLVEDLIQESMAKGDFRNLSGTGKPLSKFEHNPYSDPMTHNLNRILIDNGYQPEWIVVQKEIRESIEKMRKRLQEVRARLGNPMKHPELIQWKEHCAAFSDQLAKLNKKVEDFNLIVPLMSWQMVHFNLNKEIEKVLKADELHRKQKALEEESKLIEERENATASQQNSKQGLIMWMQSLLKLKNI